MYNRPRQTHGGERHMTGGDHLTQVYNEPPETGPVGKTFLGGSRLSARIGYFSFIGFFALVVLASGLALSFLQLKSVEGRVGEARKVMDLAAKVDHQTSVLRAAERTVLLRTQTDEIEAYKRAVSSLLETLNVLQARPEAAALAENTATIAEGLSRHDADMKKVIELSMALEKPDGGGLVERVRRAAGGAEKRIQRSGSSDLAAFLRTTRRFEQDFLLARDSADLVRLVKRHEKFKTVLASSGIPRPDRVAIGDAMTVYQDSLVAFAKARIERREWISRLDEVFTYFVPSVESVLAFAEKSLSDALRDRRRMRAMVWMSVAAGGLAIVLFLTIGGLVLMGSITRPLRSLARAAARLTRDSEPVFLPAMGNDDEIGDLAHVLNVLGKGREQVEGLRRELEARKAELANVAQSVEEIFPGDDDQAEQAPQEEPPAAVNDVAASVQADHPLSGPISSISRQLALSSQSVSVAAFQAEKTSSMLRGLDDATRRVARVELILGDLAERVNTVLSMPRTPAPRNADGNAHLVLLSSDHGDGGLGGWGNGEAAREMDLIRSLSVELDREVRDVSLIIDSLKAATVELARLSSSEALEVTTALLRQSEHLRGMLGELVGTVRDAGAEHPGTEKTKKPQRGA
jgi:methyl-accepting chemotaxis protein